jgi:AcrR family transcriptional regulator
VGRPRADGKPHLSRERALIACLKLIAKHGYAGTGIRMMADELSASPASLFNLFGSKEGILNEIITLAARPSLEFHERMNQVPAAPVAKLYKSIYEEVVAVASADADLVGLFYLPELRKSEMQLAQDVRLSMIQHYERLISAGARAGDLKVDDLTQTAEQVFQLTETAIIGGPKLRKIKPKALAKQTARFCLRSLLSDPARLEEIEVAAFRIKLKFELPNPAG